MRVRYNLVITSILLLLGTANLVLGLWLSQFDGFQLTMLIGPLLMLLAVLQLVRPYFVVRQGQLEIPALIGPTRTVAFHAIVPEQNKLFVVDQDGARTRLPVARFIAHSGDWDAVVARAGQSA